MIIVSPGAPQLSIIYFSHQIFGLELIEDKVVRGLSPVLVARSEETVCMMRNGINDFMDYFAIVVVILIPTIIGTSDNIHHLINFSAKIIRKETFNLISSTSSIILNENLEWD